MNILQVSKVVKEFSQEAVPTLQSTKRRLGMIEGHMLPKPNKV